MKTVETFAREAIALMDLTALNDTDTDSAIAALCHQANSPEGPTAAVCVYPQFIPTARDTLQALESANIKIATVVNFPSGNEAAEDVVEDIRKAISLGADEIDVVFPYRALKEGDETTGIQLIQSCKRACGSLITLKVIIESGELADAELIYKAASLSIASGANFIKTSTGKVPVNATPEAVKVMLQAIKDSHRDVGIKIAGGVQKVEQAQLYLQMAEQMMGEAWITPSHFRFGASSLLGNLLQTLGHSTSTTHSHY